jgi:hypothetical protein
MKEQERHFRLGHGNHFPLAKQGAKSKHFQ